MEKVTIRFVEESDLEGWARLYHGYADHYQVDLTTEGLGTTFAWLMDENHPLTGIVAEGHWGLIALAHFRAMPSPLRGAEIGFLDDLFVDPDHRGHGVAGGMLEAVRDYGRDMGWPLVRWITRDNNYRARGLYDHHAVKSDWNTYEMTCD